MQPNRFLVLRFKANSCLFFLKAVVFGCFLDWFSGKKFLIFLKVDVVGTMDRFFRNSDGDDDGDAFQNDQKHWTDLQYQKNYEIIRRDRYVQTRLLNQQKQSDPETDQKSNCRGKKV